MNVDWNQALRIMGSGVLAVFIIMTILAVMTHLVGKIMARLSGSKKGGG